MIGNFICVVVVVVASTFEGWRGGGEAFICVCVSCVCVLAVCMTHRRIRGMTMGGWMMAWRGGWVTSIHGFGMGVGWGVWFL